MYISVHVTIVIRKGDSSVDYCGFPRRKREFFSCIKAGQYHIEVTEELKTARLLKTFVGGNKIDALIVSGIDFFFPPALPHISIEC